MIKYKGCFCQDYSDVLRIPKKARRSKADVVRYLNANYLHWHRRVDYVIPCNGPCRRLTCLQCASDTGLLCKRCQVLQTMLLVRERWKRQAHRMFQLPADIWKFICIKCIQ